MAPEEDDSRLGGVTAVGRRVPQYHRLQAAMAAKGARCLKSAVTIGNFDGVHVGHAALVRAAREAVGPSGKVIAMTFDPHPASILAPDRAPPRLTTFERRRDLLLGIGADQVVRLEPSPEFLDLEPEAFVEQVLAPLSPSVVVEGPDFRFGKKRRGDSALLRSLGASRGFSVLELAGLDVDLSDQLLVRASSTVTRWLIQHGRVMDARAVLGRPYLVDGITRRGDQRGRTIGFPTANIHTDQLLPADGVYGGTLTLPDGRAFLAAINVGTRPTFNGVGRRIEAYAMNDDGSPAPLPATYDWNASITFEHWVREDLRFASLDALVAQIARDTAAVRRLEATHA